MLTHHLEKLLVETNSKGKRRADFIEYKKMTASSSKSIDKVHNQSKHSLRKNLFSKNREHRRFAKQ